MARQRDHAGVRRHQQRQVGLDLRGQVGGKTGAEGPPDHDHRAPRVSAAPPSARRPARPRAAGPRTRCGAAALAVAAVVHHHQIEIGAAVERAVLTNQDCRLSLLLPCRKNTTPARLRQAQFQHRKARAPGYLDETLLHIGFGGEAHIGGQRHRLEQQQALLAEPQRAPMQPPRRGPATEGRGPRGGARIENLAMS